MDGTPEGMALAQAARQAVARGGAGKRAAEGDAGQAAPKRQQGGPAPPPRPPPFCTHEVAVPDGFAADSNQLDPAIHGAQNWLLGTGS
jgi:hypothetical protein